MKTIILICVCFLTFLGMAMFLSSCEAPYQITETITKDSLGREIHVITKKYDNGTTAVVPQASINLVTYPYWNSFYGNYYGGYYTMPIYNYSPRVIVPVHPNIHYIPRGGRH